MLYFQDEADAEEEPVEGQAEDQGEGKSQVEPEPAKTNPPAGETKSAEKRRIKFDIKAADPAKAKSKETLTEKCVVFQFVKPKTPKGRVLTAFTAILTGPKKGHVRAVPFWNMTVWGYSLKLANLVSGLKYGDEGTIEFK